MLLVQIEHLISCFSCCGVCCILACNNFDTISNLSSNGASRIRNAVSLDISSEHILLDQNEHREHDHVLDSSLWWVCSHNKGLTFASKVRRSNAQKDCFKLLNKTMCLPNTNHAQLCWVVRLIKLLIVAPVCSWKTGMSGSICCNKGSMWMELHVGFCSSVSGNCLCRA